MLGVIALDLGPLAIVVVSQRMRLDRTEPDIEAVDDTAED